MSNAIKKTVGGQNFNVLTRSAKQELAAAAEEAEQAQRSAAAPADASTKTKGRTSRKTGQAPVEEAPDDAEETTADD